MRRMKLVGCLCLLALAATSPARGWSLVQEVTLLEPGLTAQMVWEIVDSKSYCSSNPPNLDRLACRLADPNSQSNLEFWIGIDSAGSRYGVISGQAGDDTYFDIHRSPAGTHLSQHIIRITERVEAGADVTKLQIAGTWMIDPTSGEMLIGLEGQCLTSACTAQFDTTFHLGLVRISGLPALLDIVESYQPPGSIAFRVPTLPEGLPTGSQLDVYTGNPADLPDLSLALPMACDVAPGLAPGSMVVVPDSLPPPAAGQVRYYVTTVTSGADRRAGRQSIGGVLSGRDADALPACAIP